MEYIIDNETYEVVIVKKHNKNTYIRVKDDMRIYVTTNYLVTKKYVKKLLDDNYDSINKMLNQIRKKNEKQKIFFYLGKPYDIIEVSTIEGIDLDDINNIIYIKNNKELIDWLNIKIKDIFNSHFKDIYELFEEVNKIPTLKIRKMKSRWGVYNRKNHSVTLNSELIKYDLECLDYVIVHELSHIIHFDHSKNFWNLVSKYCKDYKEIKKQLKE